MTRDEAIETLREVRDRNHGSIGWMSDAGLAASLDAYVSLGMLELNEPASAATKRAVHVLAREGWDTRVLDVLKRAGLKIVEA